MQKLPLGNGHLTLNYDIFIKDTSKLIKYFHRIPQPFTNLAI